MSACYIKTSRNSIKKPANQMNIKYTAQDMPDIIKDAARPIRAIYKLS